MSLKSIYRPLFLYPRESFITRLEVSIDLILIVLGMDTSIKLSAVKPVALKLELRCPVVLYTAVSVI
jgi:hypothetical protein